MKQSIFCKCTKQLNWSVIGLALSLIVPSAGVMHKYLGIIGVIAYVIFAFSTLLLFRKYAIAGIMEKISDKFFLGITVATFLILLIVFLVAYPIANSGLLGKGSDRDEALNIATTELLKGNYPYYKKTYLGNPISPMPGSLFLAVPFVLLGNSAYQNLFWLFAFFVTMKSYLKGRRPALSLLWIIIVLSPIVMQDYVVGGDFLANSIYILLFVIWTVYVMSQDDSNGWIKVLMAILLGIGFASRANFVLILPLVFSALVRIAGERSAIKYILIACLCLGIMTIPFYIYDPHEFSPLHNAKRFDQLKSILPFPGILIPAFSGIIALVLSIDRKNSCLPILLRNCFIVLSFPIFIGTIFNSFMNKNLDFSFVGFGLSFLFFGTVAFSRILFWEKSNGHNWNEY